MDTCIKDVNRNLQNPNPASKGNVLNSSDNKGLSPPPKSTPDSSSEDVNFTIKIYKGYKISIYKPLIPLKITLFFWFGAGASVQPFLSVYFKQKGLTLSELSTVYMIIPIAQVLGSAISGIIADKLGRSKPVLVVNLLLTVSIVVGILLVPRMESTSCEPQKMELECHRQQFDKLIAKSNCHIPENVISVSSCNVYCPENETNYEIFGRNDESLNLSLYVHLNDSFTTSKQFIYSVNSTSHKNTTYTWCSILQEMHCNISCIKDSLEKYETNTSSRAGLLTANMALLVLFLSTFSNCYRFMDITTMALVKEHNSDFGHERFFSISGVLVMAPISGSLVKFTTPEGGERNYAAAFYFFIALLFVCLGVIYRLPVRINSPGKKMWKKSLTLLKNPDVVSFILVVFVLGTTWGFINNFMSWYLEELKAPSFLFGVVPAVTSLYGLPFLLTSKWWVQKIGVTRIFVLGLLAYVVNTTSYSFLHEPWLALLLEATAIVTYSLVWVSVILYSSELAPEGLTATVLTTAGALHYGIGKASGSAIGGQVMAAFGSRIAYRVMAIICLISAVLYSLYLYIRHAYVSKKKDLNHKAQETNLEEYTPSYVVGSNGTCSLDSKT